MGLEQSTLQAEIEIKRHLLLYPISNDDTEDVQSEFNSNELAPRGMFCGFGCPDGCNGVEDTGPNTIQDAG